MEKVGIPQICSNSSIEFKVEKIWQKIKKSEKRQKVRKYLEKKCPAKNYKKVSKKVTKKGRNLQIAPDYYIQTCVL